MKDFFKRTVLNGQWWEFALKRAGWTIAQTALGGIGSAVLITEVDWIWILNACALAGIASLLKSALVGMPEIEEIQG